MRRVVYGGAMSLDGYIAGPNGEYDWILMDPDMDFAAMNQRFDTFLIGRKTFEAMKRSGTDGMSIPGIKNIIFSRTLKPSEHPNLAICADAESMVAELRTKPGRISRYSEAVNSSGVCWRPGSSMRSEFH